MPKRKEKVVIPKVPPIVSWMIDNATGQQLAYTAQIARGDSFRLLINLFEKFKDYSVYEVFRAPVRDGNELSDLRSAARGRTSAYDAFIMFCQVSQKEIIRRRKERGSKK